MSTDFITKTGDTTPILSHLKDADGNKDLTDATVVFNLNEPDGTQKVIRGACVVIDAPTGYVKYLFLAADVDTAGSYRAEFEVTFTDGVITTFPNDDYIPVLIRDDLG